MRIAKIAIASALFLFFGPHAALMANDKDQECADIGDTIVIRGKIQPLINGGTYFVPLKKICARYPKKTDHFIPTDLITTGYKLPPDVYVELRGKLSDPWPLVGIGIHVISFRNVDDEVKAMRAEWKRQCDRWQDVNIPALRARTHGGQVGRDTDENDLASPARRCGIAAADTKLPHGVIYIWRPVR